VRFDSPPSKPRNPAELRRIIQIKDNSREGTALHVPVARGRLCWPGPLFGAAAAGLLCWALHLRGSPSQSGGGGSATALGFGSRFVSLQVGDWLRADAAEKRGAGQRARGAAAAPPRPEVEKKSGWGGRGCRRERLLGREQDAVPCAPGNTQPLGLTREIFGKQLNVTWRTPRCCQMSFLTHCSQCRKG